jgi:hypothetical protein
LKGGKKGQEEKFREMRVGRNADGSKGITRRGKILLRLGDEHKAKEMYMKKI